jgi:hypothetical protein
LWFRDSVSAVMQPTVEALVVALKMIVSNEFSDGVPQMSLTEEHELVRTLALDRQDEPFGVGVQVRAVRRQLDTLDASSAEQVTELASEQRIASVDHIAHIAQEPVDAVGEVARHLLHPFTVDMARDAGDLHVARLDVDDKQDAVADEPGQREHLYVEEVHRRESAHGAP